VKKVAYPALLLVLYLSVLLPFTSYTKNRPYGEKLGNVPKGEVLKYISADQKEFIAATMVMKVLFYFGGVVDTSFNKLDLPVDYPAMSRSLHAAVKLDPYNMDAYYFAQATLVWDAKQIKLANDLLEYGMQYRTWDFYLPFFVGFNSAYFLKDYAKAAEYYKRAGELSGSELFINLAGRYLYESGKSKMAIDYLTVMEKGASTPAIKRTFQIRLQAIKEGQRIELARDRYLQETGRLPSTVEELLRKGYLADSPVDPYGGTFYLEPDGSVRSTSKFAFGVSGKNDVDRP
jgi:tetratricopeptide (TPR) repeat protein